MSYSFDVIVIGSGFGGAITSCRLAQKNQKVLVLERGRRWKPTEFPAASGKHWIYDIDEPEKQNGWLDFRFLHEMWVAQGAGVGGGSLIYANVSIEAKPEIFQSGWPQEITYPELKPYYDKVGDMLCPTVIPDNQLSPHYKLMREAANNAGYGNRFDKLPIAVRFSPNFRYDAPDPFNKNKSEPITNAQGVQQGTCVHCGNCDIGCQVLAKNTLDLNYIPLAEKHGAEVRHLHLVTRIEPYDQGYRVHFDRLQNERRIPGSETARTVIVAGGTLNTNELLLRCRDQYKTLPNLSRRLGDGFSCNADFLAPSFGHPHEVDPTQGPTITSRLDFFDGSVDGQRFFIEDGGAPDVRADLFQGWLRRAKWFQPWRFWGSWKELAKLGRGHHAFPHSMLWFAVGMDAADGKFYLGRNWWWPWSLKLKLAWDPNHSDAVIDSILHTHQKLAAASGGELVVPPTWYLFMTLATAHPLGGCHMGKDASKGVVDHKGQVFGYNNLYIADGSIVPTSVGLNPSRTIGALAERIAALMQV